MSEWNSARLVEVCVDGGIQTGPFGSQLHQSDYSQEGTPVIMPKDIKGGIVDVEGIARVEEKHVERLARHKVERNNIVFPRRGDVAKAAFITEREEGWLCGTGCLKVVLNEVRVSPEFIRYHLALPSSVKWLETHAVGSTMPNINATILGELPILLPSLTTQRKIAVVLSDYDAAIANCRKQIVLLEEAAMRLYREWFGDGKGEKGPISKWFNITIGRTPPRKVSAYFSESDGNLKWCSIADIKSTNTYVFDTAEKLTPLAVADSKIHISPPGTILLSFKLTVGRVAIAADQIATNEAIAHFETDDRAFRDYTYCYLKDFKFSTLGSTSSIGTAINSDIVKDMPFIKPKGENVKRFSCRVSPLFDSILAFGRQIRTLTEARDRLLPKLMKGDIAV